MRGSCFLPLCRLQPSGWEAPNATGKARSPGDMNHGPETQLFNIACAFARKRSHLPRPRELSGLGQARPSAWPQRPGLGTLRWTYDSVPGCARRQWWILTAQIKETLQLDLEGRVNRRRGALKGEGARGNTGGRVDTQGWGVPSGRGLETGCGGGKRKAVTVSQCLVLQTRGVHPR